MAFFSNIIKIFSNEKGNTPNLVQSQFLANPAAKSLFSPPIPFSDFTYKLFEREFPSRTTWSTDFSGDAAARSNTSSDLNQPQNSSASAGEPQIPIVVVSFLNKRTQETEICVVTGTSIQKYDSQHHPIFFTNIMDTNNIEIEKKLVKMSETNYKSTKQSLLSKFTRSTEIPTTPKNSAPKIGQPSNAEPDQKEKKVPNEYPDQQMEFTAIDEEDLIAFQTAKPKAHVCSTFLKKHNLVATGDEDGKIRIYDISGTTSAKLIFMIDEKSQKMESEKKEMDTLLNICKEIVILSPTGDGKDKNSPELLAQLQNINLITKKIENLFNDTPAGFGNYAITCIAPLNPDSPISDDSFVTGNSKGVTKVWKMKVQEFVIPPKQKKKLRLTWELKNSLFWGPIQQGKLIETSLMVDCTPISPKQNQNQQKIATGTQEKAGVSNSNTQTSVSSTGSQSKNPVLIQSDALRILQLTEEKNQPVSVIAPNPTRDAVFVGYVSGLIREFQIETGFLLNEIGESQPIFLGTQTQQQQQLQLQYQNSVLQGAVCEKPMFLVFSNTDNLLRIWDFFNTRQVQSFNPVNFADTLKDFEKQISSSKKAAFLSGMSEYQSIIHTKERFEKMKENVLLLEKSLAAEGKFRSQIEDKEFKAMHSQIEDDQAMFLRYQRSILEASYYIGSTVQSIIVSKHPTKPQFWIWTGCSNGVLAVWKETYSNKDLAPGHPLAKKLKLIFFTKIHPSTTSRIVKQYYDAESDSWIGCVDLSSTKKNDNSVNNTSEFEQVNLGNNNNSSSTPKKVFTTAAGGKIQSVKKSPITTTTIATDLESKLEIVIWRKCSHEILETEKAPWAILKTCSEVYKTFCIAQKEKLEKPIHINFPEITREKTSGEKDKALSPNDSEIVEKLGPETAKKIKESLSSYLEHIRHKLSKSHNLSAKFLEPSSDFSKLIPENFNIVSKSYKIINNPAQRKAMNAYFQQQQEAISDSKEESSKKLQASFSKAKLQSSGFVSQGFGRRKISTPFWDTVTQDEFKFRQYCHSLNKEQLFQEYPYAHLSMTKLKNFRFSEENKGRLLSMMKKCMGDENFKKMARYFKPKSENGEEQTKTSEFFVLRQQFPTFTSIFPILSSPPDSLVGQQVHSFRFDTIYGLKKSVHLLRVEKHKLAMNSEVQKNNNNNNNKADLEKEKSQAIIDVLLKLRNHIFMSLENRFITWEKKIIEDHNNEWNKINVEVEIEYKADFRETTLKKKSKSAAFLKKLEEVIKREQRRFENRRQIYAKRLETINLTLNSRVGTLDEKSGVELKQIMLKIPVIFENMSRFKDIKKELQQQVESSLLMGLKNDYKILEETIPKYEYIAYCLNTNSLVVIKRFDSNSRIKLFTQHDLILQPVDLVSNENGTILVYEKSNIISLFELVYFKKKQFNGSEIMTIIVSLVEFIRFCHKRGFSPVAFTPHDIYIDVSSFNTSNSGQNDENDNSGDNKESPRSKSNQKLKNQRQSLKNDVDFSKVHVASSNLKIFFVGLFNLWSIYNTLPSYMNLGCFFPPELFAYAFFEKKSTIYNIGTNMAFLMSKSKRSPVNFETSTKKVSDLFKNMIEIGAPRKKSQFVDFMKLFRPKDETNKNSDQQDKEIDENLEEKQRKLREEHDRKAKEIMEEKQSFIEPLVNSSFDMNFSETSLVSPRSNVPNSSKTVLDNFIESVSNEFPMEEDSESKDEVVESLESTKERFFERLEWLQEDAEKFFGSKVCDLVWRMMKFLPTERPSLVEIIEESGALGSQVSSKEENLDIQSKDSNMQ